MSRKTTKRKNRVIQPPVVASRPPIPGERVWWWVRRAGERKSVKTFGVVKDLSPEGLYTRIKFDKPHPMVSVSVIEIRRLNLL